MMMSEAEYDLVAGVTAFLLVLGLCASGLQEWLVAITVFVVGAIVAIPFGIIAHYDGIAL